MEKIENNLLNNPNAIEYLIEEYIKKFLDSLQGFRLDTSTIDNNTFIKAVEDSIAELLLKRNEFLSFLQIIIKTKFCTDDLLISFYERLLQMYDNSNIELTPSGQLEDLVNDNYRYFNQDLFISIATMLLRNERYEVLAGIVRTNFIVVRENDSGIGQPYNFTRFYEYNYTLNKYKNERENLRLTSVVAPQIKENAISFKFQDIISTDILLYYLSLNSSGIKMNYWFPETACFNHRYSVLPKLISKRHFNKIKILFGVNTVEDFVKIIANIEEPDIRNRFGYNKIPNIKVGLCIDNVNSVD